MEDRGLRRDRELSERQRDGRKRGLLSAGDWFQQLAFVPDRQCAIVQHGSAPGRVGHRVLHGRANRRIHRLDQLYRPGPRRNQPVTVQFSPNPSGPAATVNFTVFAPTTGPTGVNGPAPFTLVLTGRDTSGAITATANATLVLQPDFNLSVTPVTTSSSPAPVTQNSTLPVTVQVVAGTGFTGTVFIDFPNLPAGFSASPGNVTAGAQGSFPITVSAAASPGPALITVRGTLSSGAIKTATLFLNVISDFTLNVSPASSQAAPNLIASGGTLTLAVSVVSISGFAGTVIIDTPNLPAGFTVIPANGLTLQGG